MSKKIIALSIFVMFAIVYWCWSKDDNSVNWWISQATTEKTVTESKEIPIAEKVDNEGVSMEWDRNSWAVDIDETFEEEI